MDTILIAVGIVLIIEGLPYFIIPEQVKEITKRIQEIPSSSLRLFGFTLMLAGLIVVYLARRYIL
ncbi:MAG: hypothetical protein A2W05_05185 [Candidatus Schekmanbacteria bacterium RBG_16_38_10]|uniref:DUF2065 domain-containing protein n=1 Tax=Candidatus Schekmanbacteria bacterium RBG_16_38_10 TaxID=1817879 RepID=A0A1F7RS77_9BACT|nr:MAG: hypothetical protein A2W05_05185 [Candidatus Schekmanbacteria bacterium RBG_16_38_10]